MISLNLGTMETLGLSRVWIERTARGEITYGVQVPASDVAAALKDAKRIYRRLQRFATKMADGDLSATLKRSVTELRRQVSPVPSSEPPKQDSGDGKGAEVVVMPTPRRRGRPRKSQPPQNPSQS